MADIQELGRTIRVTWGLGIAILVMAVMGTWVGAEIYFEFQHLKREAARIESRLDKITKRNADAIKINAKDVAELKLPNSDK